MVGDNWPPLRSGLLLPGLMRSGQAVGTGLDYFRLTGDLEWQRERFRTHIRAAILAGKPLIIHTRSAAEDTLCIMMEEGAKQVGGVMFPAAPGTRRPCR